MTNVNRKQDLSDICCCLFFRSNNMLKVLLELEFSKFDSLH